MPFLFIYVLKECSYFLNFLSFGSDYRENTSLESYRHRMIYCCIALPHSYQRTWQWNTGHRRASNIKGIKIWPKRFFCLFYLFLKARILTIKNKSHWISGFTVSCTLQSSSEETSALSPFVLVRDDRDLHFRVVILNSVEDLKVAARSSGQAKVALSRLALLAMLQLLKLESAQQLRQKLFRRVSDLLVRGSSVALGQVKSMLEYSLWGPADLVAFSTSGDQEQSASMRETELQRWVDLERATVLNKVIRSQGFSGKPVDLAVYEEYQLLFLVQTCAKMLHEASLLFQSAEVACM